MKKFLLFFLLTIFMLNTAFAMNPCPDKIQAVLLTKITSFIREVGGAPKSTYTIGVLNGGPMLDILKKAAASSNKLKIISVSINNIKDANIVFVPKGTSPDLVKQVKAAAVKNKILTVAGDPNFVVNQGITLSFHLVNGKPRMLISVASAAEEGVKFAATFLRIAEKVEK